MVEWLLPCVMEINFSSMHAWRKFSCRAEILLFKTKLRFLIRTVYLIICGQVAKKQVSIITLFLMHLFYYINSDDKFADHFVKTDGQLAPFWIASIWKKVKTKKQVIFNGCVLAFLRDIWMSIVLELWH